MGRRACPFGTSNFWKISHHRQNPHLPFLKWPSWWNINNLFPFHYNTLNPPLPNCLFTSHTDDMITTFLWNCRTGSPFHNAHPQHQYQYWSCSEKKIDESITLKIQFLLPAMVVIFSNVPHTRAIVKTYREFTLWNIKKYPFNILDIGISTVINGSLQ